jgi:hypothetical protein
MIGEEVFAELRPSAGAQLYRRVTFGAGLFAGTQDDSDIQQWCQRRHTGCDVFTKQNAPSLGVSQLESGDCFVDVAAG